MLVGVEGGQHDHPGRVGLGVQRPGRLEAVEHRHPDVHQHDVGAALGAQRHARPAVGGLADDLEVGLAAEHQRERRPDQRVVVDDQHPDRWCRTVRHAAHGIQPCRTNVDPSRAVLEPAAAQLGALGEPDQAEPGARRAAAARSPSGLRTSTSTPVVRGCR